MTKLTKKQNVSKEMTFKDDKLNRKNIAENFNLIFEETSQPFVVALDSSWGTGKTQFIHMWRNLLEEKESIYLNLWEEDFLRNPFFSLTETLSKKFEEKKIGKSATRKDFENIGHELSKGMVSKVFGADIDALAGKNYNTEQKNKKEEFKKNLRNLAKDVKKKTKFPLLIFIDELDRCRPDYAVEFLEIAKHFFNIENIIFIFGIDMKQLQHSVKSLYGEGMDAGEYLRKFIDIDYSFPEPKMDDYLDFLFSEFECGKKDSKIIMVIKEIIKKFNPPPRKIDHLFTRLNLIEKDIDDSYIQASFLLSLKTFKREVYNGIINGSHSTETILNLMKYFETRGSTSGKIIFWRIANDWILRNSNTERKYLSNLEKLFAKLTNEWHGIKEILSNFDNFTDTHYSTNYLLKIFLEDNGLSKQPNMDIAYNIFRHKDAHLREFKELIQKIDFLEGLDFSKEVEDED